MSEKGSTSTWDAMRRAKEEAYFEDKNSKALERLKAKKEKPLLSPITGKPMLKQNIHGVLVDVCPDSKGIWLDAGELEHLLELSGTERASNKKGWVEEFLSGVFNLGSK